MVYPRDTSTADRQLPPSQAIIEAVASAEGVDVLDLRPPAYEPLYSAIDPEALDLLFDHPTESNRSGARVSFTYEGYDIVVYDGGRVDVSEASSSNGAINSIGD